MLPPDDYPPPIFTATNPTAKPIQVATRVNRLGVIWVQVGTKKPGIILFDRINIYVGTKTHKFPLPVMDMPVCILGSVIGNTIHVHYLCDLTCVRTVSNTFIKDLSRAK
jgi:hypothetical protein